MELLFKSEIIENKENKMMRIFKSKKISYSVLILIFIFAMIFIDLSIPSNNNLEDNSDTDINEKYSFHMIACSLIIFMFILVCVRMYLNRKINK